MKLAFFGSPEFAVPALRALVGVGHEIMSVYTQPPQVSGRGQNVQGTSIHAIASELGLPIEAIGPWPSQIAMPKATMPAANQ